MFKKSEENILTKVAEKHGEAEQNSRMHDFLFFTNFFTNSCNRLLPLVLFLQQSATILQSLSDAVT